MIAFQRGTGIYFAETPEDSFRKATKKGVTLEAKVRLGNVKEMPHLDSTLSFSKLQRSNHDSVRTTALNGAEYVVYNKDQVGSIRPVKQSSLRLWLGV